MISKIDLLHMEPYDGKDWKSFEMLCFILAKAEFPTGRFTAINGAGGDGGVEFFMDAPKGKIIGWQCKFFDKLGDSQKSQIKQSCKQVSEKHKGIIKEWILCTPIDFTPLQNKWLDELRKEFKIKITHWGESEILDRLSHQPELCNFFFNDGFLTKQWFDTHAMEVLGSEIVKRKYISATHVDIHQQRRVALSTSSTRLKKKLYKLAKQPMNLSAFNALDNYRSKISQHPSANSGVDDVSSPDISSLVKMVSDKAKNIRAGFEEVCALNAVSDWVGINTVFKTLCKKAEDFYQSAEKLTELLRPDLEGLYFHISRIGDFVNHGLFLIRQAVASDLHIVGGASMGKSHLALDLFYNYRNADHRKPSVAILARNLNGDCGSLEKAILQRLDLESKFSFDEFLSALNVAGKVAGYRVPIVIDGLNELYGYDKMWRRDLEPLMIKVRQYPNLLLLITYRRSYIPYLGLDSYLRKPTNELKIINVDGIGFGNIDKAISLYLKHYDITLKGEMPEMLKQLMSHNPIMLSIFCEIHKGEKNVAAHEESLFSMFDLLLDICDSRVCEALDKDPVYDKKFLLHKIDGIARWLWVNNRNSISDKDMRGLLTVKEIRAVYSEDLLVMHEYRDGVEEFAFTFDILAGYVVAKSLLADIKSETQLIDFVNSDEFQEKLIAENANTNHPLKDVITDCFLLLALARFGFFYSDKCSVPAGWVIRSLSKSPADVLIENKDEISDFVAGLLYSDPSALSRISTTSLTDPRHPLSLRIVTEITKALPVYLRDLSWSELIRRREDVRKLIETLPEPSLLSLTSTMTKWRYGQVLRFYDLALNAPDHFVMLTAESFRINDPYVQEGMVSAAYGAVLALQDVSNEPLTLPLANAIADAVESGHPIQINHYLIRNYLRLIMRMAAGKGYEINKSVEDAIFSPDTHADSILSSLPETSSEKYPLMHDFSNYTLGRIIPNGGAYNNPPLKRKARTFVIDEIARQGWNAQLFESVDREIVNSNYSHLNEKLGKTERYGKKYAWNAYYRVATLLEDAATLKSDFYLWRVPEVPYDASFPKFGADRKLPHPDLLQPEDIPIDEWMKIPFSTDLAEGVAVRNINGDEFVCLCGCYSQRNTDSRRKHVVFLTSILVDKNKATRFRELTNIAGNDFQIREPGHVTDCLGAEIDCVDEVDFSPRLKINLKTGETVEYEDTITAENIFQYGIQVAFRSEEESEMHRDDALKIGDKVKRTENVVEEFEIEYPIVEYLSEDGFSDGNYLYLNPRMKRGMMLRHNPKGPNLLDADGREVLKVFQFQPESYEGRQYFVYIRKDFLDDWMASESMQIVTLAWGEKETWDEITDSDPHPLHQFEYFSLPL